ncbi:unnamed protein product [Periconia digitata]|uniref:Uncharacterized protein n=1 Tax=Periconia digitata TaxID=1303443 RepID=A0A9W4XKQ9_9PLEO|nr:unnamed protein product [Periconia digitata]
MASFGAFLHRQFFGSLPTPKADLTGQTVIVTGSNTGLGREAARHFVRLGASTVIIAVRSTSKGDAAKADIEKSEGKTGVLQVWHLDMSSHQSVVDFAARVGKELDRVDIAILNAGIGAGKWEVFADDESIITVNVVSTFLLALSLLPKLVDTANKFNKRPTLSIVASDVHYWAKFKELSAPEGKLFEALNAKPQKVTDGFMMERYQVSKLMEVFGIRAIADRKPAAQFPVTVNCCSPGLCHSEFARDGGIAFAIFKFFLARSTEYGSRALVHAGLSGPESHGHYQSEAAIQKPSDFVLSAEGYKAQDRVWRELSQKLEGIKPGVTSVV